MKFILDVLSSKSMGLPQDETQSTLMWVYRLWNSNHFGNKWY